MIIATKKVLKKLETILVYNLIQTYYYFNLNK